jgi:1,4-alpha-glucan branching enzyme
MLYRDYDRKDGEWIANEDGGNANHEAASLLRELNGIVRAEHPGVLCIAEESTAWQGVTAPPEIGGLGFHLKWNMGWMHDTLSFMALDPVMRSGSHDRITFHQWYAYDDKWVLPLSHDEVVHGKRSLIDKMPGDWWRKRAQLRLLFAWQAAVPGRPLLFQGAEFGMGREFDWTRSPDWDEAAEPDRRALTACLAEALGLYRSEPALHRRDDHRDGFRWIDCENRAESIVAFLRLAPGVRPVLAAYNFTPVPRPDYPLTVDGEGSWRVLLDTDAVRFGGAGFGSTGPLAARWEGDRRVVRLHLPALAAVLITPA